MNAPRLAGPAGFRAKLTLALMAIVFAVTALALFIAGRSAETGVQVRLQREFHDEFAAYFAVQATRRAAVTEHCHTLARSVRIRAALEENDVRDLYANGAVELREVLAGGPGPRLDARLPRAEFFRFLDAQGAVLTPPAAAEAAAWEVQFSMAAAPVEQQVGYVLAKAQNAAEALYEIIATPIVATDTGEVMGALVLGFAAGDFGVFGGNAILENAGGGSGPESRRVDIVLQSDRHSEQWAGGVAGLALTVTLSGLFEGGLFGQSDERVEGGIELVDAGQAEFGEFFRRHGSLAERLGSFGEGPI